MHELSVAKDLIAMIIDVAKKNDATRVTSVTVEIGALSGIEPDALEFAFEAVSRDTMLEGCAFEMELTPLTVLCPKCAWRGEVDKLYPICGDCGNAQVEVIGGRELRLLSLDVDDDDDLDDKNGGGSDVTNDSDNQASNTTPSNTLP